jgi:hypothetical protein
MGEGTPDQPDHSDRLGKLESMLTLAVALMFVAEIGG